MFLVLTDYARYCFTHALPGNLLSLTHWIGGLALPLVLVMHIVVGRRRTPR